MEYTQYGLGSCYDTVHDRTSKDVIYIDNIKMKPCESKC